MSQTELEKRDVLRMSNKESNRLTRECLQTALITLMGQKSFDKITISELVRKSGVSRTTISALEQGKEKIVKSSTLVNLANALGTTVSKIFLVE